MRTNKASGFDLKSRNSVLVGRCELILKDAKSGKISEVIKQKNTLTHALDSLYNGAPFGLGSRQISGGAYTSAIQQPVFNKGLGGILIFPNTLNNDLDDFYPDFDTNSPTGYASMESYTQDDSRQGTFDAVNSGVLNNDYGYKYVYNWGSSFGNGRISSIALSNSKCYKYFNDLTLAALTPEYIIRTQGLNQFNGYEQVIGANKRGVYYNNGQEAFGVFPDPAFVAVWKKPKFHIPILSDWTSIIKNENFERIWQYPDYGFFFIDDDYLYFVQVTASAAASSTYKLFKVDLDDTTSVTETTHTISAHLALNFGYQGDTMAKIGNYIYIYKADGASVYKINITNDADVTEIELPSATTAMYGLNVIGGNNIVGNGFIIGADDTARACVANGALFGQFGVWAIRSAKNDNGFGASIITPYCATKANLDSPVTKTADKQMIVNYTITQE